MQDLKKIQNFRNELTAESGRGEAVINGFTIVVEQYDHGQFLYTVTEEGTDGETAEFWNGEFQVFAEGYLRW